MSQHADGILEQILEHKRSEFAKRQALRPLAELRELITQMPHTHSLRATLERRPGIIAEIKRRSPSKGEFLPKLDVLSQARAYERGGAAAISVLTDERFFGMRPEELTAVRNIVTLPVLRKDFIIDEYGVYESRALGADCVLLIVSALSFDQLGELHANCREAGIEALVEIHDEAELERALAVKAGLIGINSRNLRTFETDLGVVGRLAELRRSVAPEVTLVAESGLSQREQLDTLQLLGVRGFLIGEALLTAADPAQLLKELCGEAPR